MGVIRDVGHLSVVLCVATFFAAIVTSAGLWLFLSPFGEAQNYRELAYLLIFIWSVSAAIALCLGIPAFFFLREIGWLNPWSVFAFGTATGLAIGMSPATAGFPIGASIVLGSASAIATWPLVLRLNLTKRKEP
jgi:hypothetical protein